MSYALVENNVIVSTDLPATGVLPDGRTVSGFDKLDEDTLKTVGWYPVEDAGVPEHNPDTHSVNRILEFDAKEEVVNAVYTFIEIPPQPAPDSLPVTTQDQLDALVAKLVEKGTLTQADVDSTKKPR